MFLVESLGAVFNEDEEGVKDCNFWVSWVKEVMLDIIIAVQLDTVCDY